jgi:hypothetical protein
MVDEKTLYDTFSRFGSLISPPKIARDEAQLSKGYGFVSYSNFEASDDAIGNMNGQYLMNKDISVQYAYKKDGKGERHGDEAERMLASQAKKHNVIPELAQMPAQLLLNGSIPAAPAAMLDSHSPVPQMGMGGPPPSLPPGFGGRPNGNYNNVPPPQQRPNAPLQPPPAGLPQRPPPSQAGYGGPQDFHPPGFAPPPGFPQGIPPGFGPGGPGQMPPGFMPPGFPPQQQQGPPGYGGRRWSDEQRMIRDLTNKKPVNMEYRKIWKRGWEAHENVHKVGIGVARLSGVQGEYQKGELPATCFLQGKEPSSNTVHSLHRKISIHVAWTIRSEKKNYMLLCGCSTILYSSSAETIQRTSVAKCWYPTPSADFSFSMTSAVFSNL